MRLALAILAVGMAAASASGAPATTPATGSKSAYERLDSSRLLKAMQDLEMIELLQGLHDDLSAADNEEAVRVTASWRLGMAARKAGTERETLIDQAVESIGKLIQLRQGASDPDGILVVLADRLWLCETLGITKVGPHVSRILFLQGSRGDYQAGGQLAGEAYAELERLVRQIERVSDDWSRDAEMQWDIRRNDLEGLRKSVMYKMAWVAFYRAITLDPAQAADDAEKTRQIDLRKRLLNEAINAVSEYIDGPPQTGVKYWSLNLSGKAARELKEYENAVGYLTRATAPEAEKDVRFDSSFELCKVYIEQKKWSEADRQIEAFAQGGRQQVADEEGRAEIGLQMAFLGNYYWRQRAAAEPAQAAAHEMKAEQAFLDYLQKHPRYQREMLQLIVGAYEDAEDPAKLSPLLLVGKALDFVSLSPPAYDKAITYLETALARKDLSANLRAEAQWSLAAALNDSVHQVTAAEQTPALRRAAGLFFQLAKESPASPRAKDAAMHAVSLHDRVLQRMPNSREVMQEMVNALELLLKDPQWSQDERAQRFAYHLARLNERLDRPDEAARWYAAVPKTSDDYFLAWFNRLVLDHRQMRRAQAQIDSATIVERAETLRRGFLELARFARTEADRKDLPAERKKTLIERGSAADLQVAELWMAELGQPPSAQQHLQGLADRWKELPEIAAQVQAREIQILLEKGDTARAVEKLRELIKTSPQRTGVLVTGVVVQIRQRIEDLSGSSDLQVQSKLREWRNAYAEFAEEACKAVAAAKPAEQYPFLQMRAESWMETGKPAEALAAFDQLKQQDPADARNIYGVARSSWLLKDYKTAVETYRLLAGGLDPSQPDHKDAYWRARLEGAQCAFEAIRGQPDEAYQLQRLLVLVRQLRVEDERFSGNLERFNLLESQVGSRLKELPAAAAAAGSTK